MKKYFRVIDGKAVPAKMSCVRMHYWRFASVVRDARPMGYPKPVTRPVLAGIPF